MTSRHPKKSGIRAARRHCVGDRPNNPTEKYITPAIAVDLRQRKTIDSINQKIRNKIRNEF